MVLVQVLDEFYSFGELTAPRLLEMFLILVRSITDRHHQETTTILL